MDLKRIFDIAAASTGLVVTAPIVLVAAFTMAVVNRSFPIFKQERVGLNGEVFTLYKIKSMNDAVDANGRFLPDDERTSVPGKLIRKLRIDEFLQFWNIIKGEMSMVGPRPVPVYEPIAQDKKRHTVRPGLTGAAQLLGKNNSLDDEILSVDHTYIDNQSFWGDVWICVQTPVSIIRNFHVSHYKKSAQLSNNS